MDKRIERRREIEVLARVLLAGHAWQQRNVRRSCRGGWGPRERLAQDRAKEGDDGEDEEVNEEDHDGAVEK